MRKGDVGPWAMTAFRVVASLRGLRGTWLDPFRNNDERKLEQRLLAEFEADVDDVLAKLDAGEPRRGGPASRAWPRRSRATGG